MESFSELHNICIKVFEIVSGTTTVFVLPLFLGRVVFANIMGEGSKAFSAVKGSLTYFVLVAAFPLIVEVLFSIPEAFIPNFDSMAALTDKAPGWDVSSIPFVLDRIIEVLLALLYWVVYYLHVFFMLLMCSMAPIVFLLSSLLGVGLGLEIFLGLLIIGSSWPIIWYGFDQVHLSLVNAQTDAFGEKCLELLLTIFKGLAPLSFAGAAVKSPAGQAISKTAGGAISMARWSSGAALSGMTSMHSSASPPKSTSNSYFKRNRYSQTRNMSNRNDRDVKSDRLHKARNQSESKGLSKNENSPSRNS